MEKAILSDLDFHSPPDFPFSCRVCSSLYPLTIRSECIRGMVLGQPRQRDQRLRARFLAAWQFHRLFVSFSQSSRSSFTPSS